MPKKTKTEKTESPKKSSTKAKRPRQTASQRSLGRVFVQYVRLNQAVIKLGDALQAHLENHPVLPPVAERFEDAE